MRGGRRAGGENYFRIEAMTERTLVFYFLPKNLGNVRANFNMLLLHGLYKIPLKLVASSSTINEVNPRSPIRGIEASTMSFLDLSEPSATKDLGIIKLSIIKGGEGGRRGGREGRREVGGGRREDER